MSNTWPIAVASEGLLVAARDSSRTERVDASASRSPRTAVIK